MMMQHIFYTCKPVIPRRLQVFFRRLIVQYKLKRYAHIWPIDSSAGTPPPNWSGWPNGKKFAVVLSHDVDTRAGHDQCRSLMALDEKTGFRSSFNFPAERYDLSEALINNIQQRGFEVCVHGLKHDGKLFSSQKVFNQRAVRINSYLDKWNVRGFTSPSMHHNLQWMHVLNIEHATTTFDTDPFEPQPDGMRTIFPFWVHHPASGRRYLEIPYTLAQDYTLYIMMRQKDIAIWKHKLNWIASRGGMAMLNTHPDYMNFSNGKLEREKYPVSYYTKFLEYLKTNYAGEYFHALPGEVYQYWNQIRPI